MAEPLGKIAKSSARVRVDLFVEDAEIVAELCQQVLQHLPRPIDLSEKRIGFDEPAGACDKGAFLFRSRSVPAWNL
ncbi:hypothetical protein HJB67_26585 [Rhizobium lentis]|nr:hypothetical protein [Rhizobium lentis]MBX5013491.1 hypothetical protein [Rhizobium lentis]